MTDRNTPLDLAKGLACLLMIQVHVGSLFMDAGFRQGLWGELSRLLGGSLVAPVFMMIFGHFLLARSHGPEFLMKRGGQLLGLGLALNLGLNAHLLYRIAWDGWGLSPWPYVFGVDILVLAGLSSLLLAGLRRLIGQPLGPGLLLGLAVTVLMARPFLAGMPEGESDGWAYLAAFIAPGAWWSYFPIFPWFAYVLVGGAMASLPGMVTGRVGVAISLLIALTMGMDQAPVAMNLKAYYGHGLAFFIWTLSLLPPLWWLILRLNGLDAFAPVISVLRWMGRRVTRVYVVQWLLIGNLSTAIYQSQATERFLAWFLMVVVLSTALVRLSELIGSSDQRSQGTPGAL